MEIKNKITWIVFYFTTLLTGFSGAYLFAVSNSFENKGIKLGMQVVGIMLGIQTGFQIIYLIATYLGDESD